MKIKACRICGNTKLVKIGSLGHIPLSTFQDTLKSARKWPLMLVYCEDCTLLQLAHNTPRNLLYEDYWYQSHINPIIVQDLKEIAGLFNDQVKIWIDIGGNDGTLLEFAKAEFKISVDPSNIKPKGNLIWANKYWEDVVPVAGITADVITAVACLYDLPNPNAFMHNVKLHLSPRGTFLAQLMTLQPFIENNDVGNICHEHLEFYSYKSLVRLYERNGLEIYKVEENSMNGGSYRIFARHLDKGSVDFKEKEYTVQDFKDFFTRVEKNKKDFIEFAKKNPGFVGYGASTKANTIVNYYMQDDYIAKPSLVVDVNPEKIGKRTTYDSLVVDKIPEDTKYLWVFPYGFLKYFKDREKDYKGKWVTTIPAFKIL